MEKMVKRGRGQGHVTYFSNFGTPLISLEAEVRNLKFCTQIDVRVYQTKNIKKLSKGGVVWVT